MRNLYFRVGLILYVLLLPLIRIVIRRTTRVHVVLIHNGQFLLVKNWLARDTWRFPGGGVHKNEDPRSAVRREIAEELSIDIDQTQLVSIGEGIMQVDRLGYKYHSFAYIIKEQQTICADRKEILDYRFFVDSPLDSQPGVSDVVAKLKEEKLL